MLSQSPSAANNCSDRLYVGGFSPTLASSQIKAMIINSSDNLEVDVDVVENGSQKHRGFAFVQCRSSADAFYLLTKYSKIFQKVNFAKQEPKLSETIMNNITNIFVRGIPRELTTTELCKAFGGADEGVVQCHVADGYGFILFNNRTNAEKKMREMNGFELKGRRISLSWARPDTNSRKRRKHDDLSTIPIKQCTLPMISNPTTPPLYSCLPTLPLLQLPQTSPLIYLNNVYNNQLLTQQYDQLRNMQLIFQ